MKKQLQALILTSAFLMPTVADAQPSTDPRVADIVRAGKVRVGVHLPQFVRDPKTGEIHGHGTGVVIVPIGRALAQKLGVTLELVGNPSPPALIKCLGEGGCDMGFLGYVPARTQAGGLRAAAYDRAVHLSGAAGLRDPQRCRCRQAGPAHRGGAQSCLHACAGAHRQAGHDHRSGDSRPGVRAVRDGKADAYASPRPPILEYATQLPGSRVLDDRYGANIQAIAMPKGQAARVAYVSEFVEAAKASGLVQRAIDSVSGRGIAVAPAGNEILTGSVPAKH